MKLTSKKLKELIREELGGIDMKSQELEKTIRISMKILAKTAAQIAVSDGRMPDNDEVMDLISMPVEVLMRDIMEILKK